MKADPCHWETSPAISPGSLPYQLGVVWNLDEVGGARLPIRPKPPRRHVEEVLAETVDRIDRSTHVGPMKQHLIATNRDCMSLLAGEAGVFFNTGNDNGSASLVGQRLQ